MTTTHEQLVKRGANWLLNHGCSVVLMEPGARFGESPDVIGWHRGYFSTLIECKTSMSDFKNDAKKPHRKFPELGAGVVRYYLAPKGLLSPSVIPFDWGLLEAHKTIIKVVKKPERKVRSVKDVAYRELAYLTGQIWKIRNLGQFDHRVLRAEGCADIWQWLNQLRLVYWQTLLDIERSTDVDDIRALEDSLDDLYNQVTEVDPGLLPDLEMR